jgi:hypothetical protein
MSVKVRCGLLKHYFKRFYGLIKKRHRSKRLSKTIKKENGIMSWGLGVDAPFFFSSKFTIENKSITIIGSQSTHDDCSPIKYSIVKISKLGTSIKYFDSVVFYGDYPKDGFKHTFHIPCGTDYQIEVFNYCRYHSIGKFRIIKNEFFSEKE